MSFQVIKLSRPISGIRGPVDAEAVEEMTAGLRVAESEVFQNQIKQLEAELQQAREQSYNSGFQDGLAAEQEKHNQRVEEHAHQFKELAQRLEGEFSEQLAQLEGPITRMSFHIAEKILTSPLPDTVREGALVGTIQTFLKEVLHAGNVVIHVALDNLVLVQTEEVTESLAQTFPGKITFVADDSLGPGECLVETPEHLIDGHYTHQLELLESGLT